MGTAGPHRCVDDVAGAWEAARGRARRGLTGAWMTARPSSRCRRRCGEGDGTTAYRAESVTAASGRGRRWHRWRSWRGVDGARACMARWRPARRRPDNGGCSWTTTFGHLRSAAHEARRSAAAVRVGVRRERAHITSVACGSHAERAH
jgi:hypothetical protein